MDKLLSLTSSEFDKEHYDELLKLVETRYGVTLDQIIESKDQEEISDNMYNALDMLMVDPMKWLNVRILRTDPKLDINFVNELKKYTCQFEKKCKGVQEAIARGHLECFKYLRKNDWRHDVACALAAKHGHLECLKYLHENKFHWDEMTCEWAVEKGHLECLKYLHKNGCPWHAWSCNYAAANGHLECLKYAIENGCPFDKGYCIYYAKEYGHLDCVAYLESL